MAKVLCIEVGVERIKIVEMDFKQKNPKIYKCVDAQTPEGAVEDGYLNPEKIDAVREKIKEQLKWNWIRTKRVIFTVFSSKIISREIVVAAVKKHQIGAMIEANASEYFPIELEDYKLAHMLLQTYTEGENEGKHRVFVMAAEKKLIEGYEKLADLVGLHIADIDYAGNAVVQAAKKDAGQAPIMAVKLEAENALVTIMEQGCMMLQRLVNYQNIGLDEQEAAEEMRRTLAGTVSRVMDFYASNNEDKRVEQIYLLGEGSGQDGIAEFMAQQTGVKCRLLDHVRGAKLSKKVTESVNVNLFAAAIGSGVESVGFDAEKEKERHETNYVSACILIILLFIVIAAAMVSFAIIPYSAAALEQTQLKNKQAQLEPARVVHDEYLGIKDFFEQVRYGARLTEHSNDGILDFLTELEEKMPREIELADFSSDDEQCVMTMRVPDKETAAGVINTLRGFESLESVTVESIIEEEGESSDDALDEDRETTVSFTVTCVYYVNTPLEPTVESAATTEAAAE